MIALHVDTTPVALWIPGSRYAAPGMTASAGMSHPAASAEGLTKHFGATRRARRRRLRRRRGEIHALVGENGAGKSTLVRILGGVASARPRHDRGRRRARHFASPHDAIAAGIATIPQELRLVPALSVAENIALGDPPVRRFGPLAVIDRARMRDEARAVLAQLDFDPDPGPAGRSLGFAERQLVAIAKALRQRCRFFILDEPTAALEKREIERLFAVLARMKAQGTAIIYISHRLDEVVALADRCTVLRDGRVAAVSRRGAFAVADLVAAMTGRAAQADCRGSARARRSSAASAAGRASPTLAPACARGRGARRPARQRHRPHAPAPVRRDEAAARSSSAAASAGSKSPADAIARRHWHGAGRAPARPGHESVGARQHPVAQSRRALAHAAGSTVARAIGWWPS